MAANFLVEKLFKMMNEVYDDGFDHAKLPKAMEELDREFCAMATSGEYRSGACLLVVLLYVDPITGIPKKIVLNIGDCRAIIREMGGDPSTAGKTNALSEDHCARNDKEMARARRSGAEICDNRITGILEPFRVIGDIELKGPDKKNWIIATPEIHQSELLVGRSILVIATDGIWEVLNNDCVMELAVKKLGDNGSAKTAAEAIVDEAVNKDSNDDISVIVVYV